MGVQWLMRFVFQKNMEDILQFMEQMPFAMLLMNGEQRVISVNEIFLKAASCEYSQVEGACLDQYVLFEDENGLNLQTPYGWLEGEIVASDGKRLPSTICCQQWEVANQAYYLLFFNSITKEANFSLLQRFAENLISGINLGVLVIDREEKLVELSDMACRLLGVERKDVLNKSLTEAFPQLPNEHALLHKALLDGVTVHNQVTSWTNGNKRYDLLMDSNLLRDEFGRVVAAYAVFKDITNLRSLDEQIQRNDRLAMIGQIAAGTAHEIRNPLTSIKGFLQVLKYGLTEKGLVKEQEYTDIMLTEIDRINDLVSEFLLLSKPRDAKYEEIKISSVVEELLPFIRNEALLHRVDLKYEAAHGLPSVIADSELLKQVILNLCKNGIEAIAGDGVLTIRERFSVEENKVLLEVHDTGPGIPHYVIDKIFDPFFTTKENGTGLGLPVCQRIINDIGGNLRVSTKGFGTAFTIVLPIFNKHYKPYPRK